MAGLTEVLLQRVPSRHHSPASCQAGHCRTPRSLWGPWSIMPPGSPGQRHFPQASGKNLHLVHLPLLSLQSQFKESLLTQDLLQGCGGWGSWKLWGILWGPPTREPLLPWCPNEWGGGKRSGMGRKGIDQVRSQLDRRGRSRRGTQPAWGTSQGQQPPWFFCQTALWSPVGGPGWLNPWSRAHSNYPRIRTRVRRMKGGPQAWAVATVTSFYPFSPKSCQPLGDRNQKQGKKKKREQSGKRQCWQGKQEKEHVFGKKLYRFCTSTPDLKWSFRGAITKMKHNNFYIL